MGIALPANDTNWILKKQRPNSNGGNKNLSSGKYPKVLVPESIQEFVDKHVIEVLQKTEEGRALLEENPNGPTPTH